MNAISAATPVASPVNMQGADTAKLRSSSTEFESILLSQWIERAQQTFAASPDEPSDAAHDTLSSLGAQALGAALARQNALGIARLLTTQLSAQPAAQEVRPGNR